MKQNTTYSSNSQIGSRRAWFIWSLSALTFGYAFFHRVTPSVMVNDLMAEFAISAAILGTLSSLYFYPYVVMQVLLGPLIDRMGPRNLLTSAILAGAAGSILFATAETILVAYLGRILIGIGSAVGFLSTLALAGKWFPVERFAFLAGLTMFFGMVSGVFASGPLALFVESYGWRSAMWALGGVGFVLAAAIFLFVRNEPETESGVEDKKIISWRETWAKLGRATSTLEVWKVAFVASAMSGPMLALGTLWATPYLISSYNLSPANAAFLVSFMLIGWAIGAPFFGWLSDRIRKRKSLLVINSAIIVFALTCLVFIKLPALWLTVGFLVLAGFCGSAMTITFALGREGNPSDISASVTGIVNSLTVASGALLQPVVGLLLDWQWSGAMANGKPVYDSGEYQFAFIAILIVPVLGLLTALSLKESPINPSAK